MKKFQLERTSGQWMLFTVSSKVSLKTMLFLNGNKVISVHLLKKLTLQKHRSTFRVCCKNTLLRTPVGKMYWP